MQNCTIRLFTDLLTSPCSVGCSCCVCGVRKDTVPSVQMSNGKKWRRDGSGVDASISNNYTPHDVGGNEPVCGLFFVKTELVVQLVENSRVWWSAVACWFSYVEHECAIGMPEVDLKVPVEPFEEIKFSFPFLNR